MGAGPAELVEEIGDGAVPLRGAWLEPLDGHGPAADESRGEEKSGARPVALDGDLPGSITSRRDAVAAPELLHRRAAGPHHLQRDLEIGPRDRGSG